jgi:transglutaminase-like putative cysteine protease
MVPATSVEAAGDWRYDSSTMDFLAREGTDTQGLDYRMTAERLDLVPESMAAAPAADRSLQARFTDLPQGLPLGVKQLADQVTAGQPSKFQKATALQQWFRKDGGFRYDLKTKAGNGTDALLAFLDDRVGYCEQFASAMAVMARIEDIPARVAVGFLRPDRIGPNTWEYSSHDLHAWVELYFPGSGWVLFDPTPGSITGTAPSYTRVELPGSSGLPSISANTNLPRDELPDRGSSAPAGAEPDSASADGDSQGSGFPWLVVLGGLGGVLLLALAGVAPRTVRRLRSDRRWATWTGPEAAWAELQDTMVDLGRPWPAGLSPRAAAAQLVEFCGQPLDEYTADRPRHGAGVSPESELALERIVEAIELLRYASPGTPHTEALHAEVETCVSSLYGGAPAAARRRARWLPRSVLRAPRRPVATGSVEVVGQGGLVDHVG